MNRYQPWLMMTQIPSYSRTQLMPLHPAQILAHAKTRDVKETITLLWNTVYPADPILEPDFIGLTYGQVILLKEMTNAINGNPTSLDRILDRMLGKAAQINTNLNINKTYKDFLDEVAAKELENEGIIDVESEST